MFPRKIVSLLWPSVLLGCSVNAQVFLETGLSTAKCLAATSLANGAAVAVEDCGNATSLNSWTANGSTFSLNDGAFCLDVTNGVDADGTKLQVWACTPGDTNQDFSFTDVRDGTMIQWFGATSKVCVDVTDGIITDGNQVQVWDCDPNNNHQIFEGIPV
ncbi:ricin B lectin domain-containing protein [Mycena pura]|uniref:Ricin B lectin domain-containing protein n=1 Tax=Mycena pura TaxID=153505 RepID=A0AAD6Y0N3_9AGAR|nr:ricin B lectin domain-containing protein [Mycena pura]